jgi:hypothetical protein
VAVALLKTTRGITGSSIKEISWSYSIQKKSSHLRIEQNRKTKRQKYRDRMGAAAKT